MAGWTDNVVLTQSAFNISRFVNAAYPLPSPCNVRIRGMALGASLLGLKVCSSIGNKRMIFEKKIRTYRKLVTSRASDNALYRELKARKRDWAPNDVQDVFQIGDCKAPMQVGRAMWEGHRLAREFDSPHPAYPLP